ncbi:MAG: RNA polymerase sigma factor [Nanoarchaeota archaeon]
MVYNPSNPRSINGEAFKGGYIEDYRLVKLKLLLETPDERIDDLEDRVDNELQRLTDADREYLTKKVYQELYDTSLQFYRREAKRINNGRCVLNEDDLAEECTLRIIDYIKNYIPKGRFLSWFYRTAYNNMVSALGRERDHIERFSELRFDDALSFTPISFGDKDYLKNPAKSAEDIDIVKTCFNLLSEREQKALILATDGMRYKGIARFISTTEQNVRMIIFRARRKLQAILTSKK